MVKITVKGMTTDPRHHARHDLVNVFTRGMHLSWQDDKRGSGSRKSFKTACEYAGLVYGEDGIIFHDFGRSVKTHRAVAQIIFRWL